jgi:hypothetical protein
MVLIIEDVSRASNVIVLALNYERFLLLHDGFERRVVKAFFAGVDALIDRAAT